MRIIVFNGAFLVECRTASDQPEHCRGSYPTRSQKLEVRNRVRAVTRAWQLLLLEEQRAQQWKGMKRLLLSPYLSPFDFFQDTDEFAIAGSSILMNRNRIQSKLEEEQSMTVKLTPYINLEGRTREAIAFYDHAIGVEVLSMATYGDMPNMPDTFTDDMKNLVAHAKVKVGESELMFSDAPGGSSIVNGKRVTICITTNDVAHSRRIFEALRQDGQVNLPFQEESFSLGFGDVTDKFGVTFQIFTEIEN